MFICSIAQSGVAAGADIVAGASADVVAGVGAGRVVGWWVIIVG